MRLGPFELILILCIALIVFGPSKLPALAKSMGQAIKEFKKGTKEIVDDIEGAGDAKKTEPKAAATSVAEEK